MRISKMPLQNFFFCLITLISLTACIIGFPTANQLVEKSPTVEEIVTFEPQKPTETNIPTDIDKSIDDPLPTKTLSTGSVLKNQIDGATAVYVPEGEFLMGSEKEYAYIWHEAPEHIVYLDDYWIYEKEITNSQFAIFVKETGYKTTAEEIGFSEVFHEDYDRSFWITQEGANWAAPEGPGSSILGREDHPVVHMSWYDASKYCDWAGGRLPTEAEWEKAARGEDGRKYPWGNSQITGDKANFCDVNCPAPWSDQNQDDGYFMTAPVGSYPQGISPYGIFDMAGNVEEWVADWFDEDYYKISPYENPTGPQDGTSKIVRGGNWEKEEAFLHTSARWDHKPEVTSYHYGFRCVIPNGTSEEIEEFTSESNLPATKTPANTFSTYDEISTRINPIDKVVLIYVPAGDFFMGSGNTSDVYVSDNLVFLDKFFIYQTEVTNSQFAIFVEDTGYITTAEADEELRFVYENQELVTKEGINWRQPEGHGSTIIGRENHPVVRVSWYDASAYCEWARGRLPTDLEWVKAAIGTDGREFPWGNALNTGEKANFCDINCPSEFSDNRSDDGFKLTAPVGSFIQGASPYGVLDMAGNVAEWVEDWFDESHSNQKVVKGGGFLSGNLKASHREGLFPDFLSHDIGFRCVQSE